MKKVALALTIVALGLALAAPASAGGVRIYPSFGIHWGHGWGYYQPYWWGAPYWGAGPYWGGYTRVYPSDALRHGALDLDVSPEKAEVWVDGKPIGVADDYDGMPEYLWLERGTYDVVFYLPGYKTLARQYSIYPGLVIDVEDNLEPGEAVHPQDLGPKSHERRDARLLRDREQREEIEGRELPGREEGRFEPRGRERNDEALDARGEPGRLRLEVLPEDASVYLDGRFLGTGRELARLRAGLIVDPGEHTLNVVRPGREEQVRTFRVEPGREVEVRVELDAD